MIHPNGFISDPAFQKNAVPVLNTARLFYDGNSQGGIMGGGLTAVAPDFNRAVLGVRAMNYSTLLRRSVDFDDYAHGISREALDTEAGLYDNYPNELERPLILSLVQMLWDRGEANGYAHHMTSDPLANTPPHEVLLHPAFGDHQVANVTTEVEARTIGAHRLPAGDGPGTPLGPGSVLPIPAIASFPFSGSALVVWDSGPGRTADPTDRERAAAAGARLRPGPAQPPTLDGGGARPEVRVPEDRRPGRGHLRRRPLPHGPVPALGWTNPKFFTTLSVVYPTVMQLCPL